MTSRWLFVPGVLALPLALAACTTRTQPLPSASEEAGAPVGAPCSQSIGCGPEELCGFAIDAGCSAQGVCVMEDLGCQADGPVVCGCNGDPVGLSCEWGPGYAPLPVVSTTPGCGSAGADSGTD
ncbi:MAG TPA: hypothetical protein VIY73_05155 [Polyangiaceae bacterium]